MNLIMVWWKGSSGSLLLIANNILVISFMNILTCNVLALFCFYFYGSGRTRVYNKIITSWEKSALETPTSILKYVRFRIALAQSLS